MTVGGNVLSQEFTVKFLGHSVKKISPYPLFAKEGLESHGEHSPFEKKGDKGGFDFGF